MKFAKALRSNALFLFVTLSAMGVAGIIYYLTCQSGPETLGTQAAVVALFPFAFPKHYHNAVWLYLGLNNARRLAHIYEFAALGMFTTLMLWTAPFGKRYPSGRKSIRLVFMQSVIICFLFSLSDQIHKLFIMYRHFETNDLILDSIGYISAALFASACIALIVIPVTKPVLQPANRALDPILVENENSSK